MKTTSIVIATGLIAAFATGALAQNAAPTAPSVESISKRDGERMHPRLKRLDADSNGEISQEEFATAAKLREADTNNDGELSVQEIAAMLQKQEYERRAERMMRRMDIDGDGKVTVAEIEQHRAKKFALMDRNNDGKLERHELRKGKHAERGDRATRFERGDRHWEKRGDRDHRGKHDWRGNRDRKSQDKMDL